MSKRVYWWDFSFASRFVKENRDDIQFMSLRMYKDYNIEKTFIEDGKIVRTFSGSYQQYVSTIGSVQWTDRDTPCIHVVYKGGAEEFIACYVDSYDISSYSYCHRKLGLKGSN